MYYLHVSLIVCNLHSRIIQFTHVYYLLTCDVTCVLKVYIYESFQFKFHQGVVFQFVTTICNFNSVYYLHDILIVCNLLSCIIQFTRVYHRSTIELHLEHGSLALIPLEKTYLSFWGVFQVSFQPVNLQSTNIPLHRQPISSYIKSYRSYV